MPFTPSHAIVALPFVRSPLVPAAIAIGAMTPDLPLFLRGVGVRYGFTHAWQNVVWTALIALVLLLMWRVVLRPGLTLLAPRRLRDRLPASWRRSGADVAWEAVGGRRRLGLAWVMLSLVLGVLSHIAWDAFTHEGRQGVAALPALARPWGPLVGYKWLQHGSSVIGLVILAVFAAVWLSRRPHVRAPSPVPGWVRVSWALSLPVVLLAAWLLGLAAYGPLGEHVSVQQLAYRTLPAASGLWGALTLLLCATIVLSTGRTAPARTRATVDMADEGSVRDE